MAEYKAGRLVKSLAGHDRGRLFIIVREEAEYVYISGGAGKHQEKQIRYFIRCCMKEETNPGR